MWGIPSQPTKFLAIKMHRPNFLASKLSDGLVLPRPGRATVQRSQLASVFTVRWRTRKLLHDDGWGVSRKVNDAVRKFANEAKELARLKIIPRERIHRCAEVCVGGVTEPSMENGQSVGNITRVVFANWVYWATKHPTEAVAQGATRPRGKSTVISPVPPAAGAQSVGVASVSRTTIASGNRMTRTPDRLRREMNRPKRVWPWRRGGVERNLRVRR